MLQPTFETRAEFCIAGLGAEVAPASPEIGAVWQSFVPRMGEIVDQVAGATYGLCCPAGEQTKDPNKFIYIAGVAVPTLSDLPQGMVGREIPAREYAVFAHDEGLGPSLGMTFQRIFGEWLPNSGCEALGYDFEYYDQRFDPMTNKGTFYIYVPILRS